MADSLGILSKAAFRKDNGIAPVDAYPHTPGGTELAATHLVPFSTEGIANAFDRQSDPSLIGSGGALPSNIVSDKAAGTMEGRLKYCGWERLIMCAMGFEQPDDSPADLTSGAYAHLFELDDDLSTRPWLAGERDAGAWSTHRKKRCGSLGLYKQPNDVVWLSSYIDKMVISAAPTEAKIAIDVIPYSKTAPGSYNHANWTLPTGSTAMALFTQMVVKLGLRSGGVGALTELAVNNVELALENKMAADDQSTASGQYIVEPVRGDKRDVTLKLDFPRFNTDTDALVQLMEADGEMAASIIFTGPIIGGAVPYSLELFLPSVWINDIKNPITGPGPVRMSWELVAHRPNGTDIFEAGSYHSIRLIKDSALRMIVQNNVSTNYLTET